MQTNYKLSNSSDLDSAYIYYCLPTQFSIETPR